jgi:dipeptide/tripeptide permease
MKLIIARDIIVVLCVYALLIYAMLRKWLTPKEGAAVGAAMIFCACGWLLTAIIPVMVAWRGSSKSGLLISVVSLVPIVLAMIIGLAFVSRRMNSTALDHTLKRP